jgi:hypothetical protein
MTFGEILKELQNGRVVRRTDWREELVVFMQIPADIPYDRTWNMQSLPTDMKVLLKQYNRGIRYEHQFIIYDLCDNTATYHVFDGDDINATDWVVIEPFTYTHYE